MENIMKNKDIKNIYDKLMNEDTKLSEKDIKLYTSKIEIDGKTYNAYVKYFDESVELESYMNAFEK